MIEVNKYVYSGDYERLEAIDLKSSYPHNWDVDKLKQHDVIIARGLEACGFAAFKPPTSRTLPLLRLCVHPSHRRQGVGTSILDYIIRNMLVDKITVVLRETNLVGCQFLAANQFRAMSIMRGHFDDEDGIYFKRVV